MLSREPGAASGQGNAPAGRWSVAGASGLLGVRRRRSPRPREADTKVKSDEVGGFVSLGVGLVGKVPLAVPVQERARLRARPKLGFLRGQVPNEVLRIGHRVLRVVNRIEPEQLGAIDAAIFAQYFRLAESEFLFLYCFHRRSAALFAGFTAARYALPAVKCAELVLRRGRRGRGGGSGRGAGLTAPGAVGDADATASGAGVT